MIIPAWPTLRDADDYLNPTTDVLKARQMRECDCRRVMGMARNSANAMVRIIRLSKTKADRDLREACLRNLLRARLECRAAIRVLHLVRD